MSDSATRLRPATKANPCVVCQGDHKCSRKEDGFILCGRKTGDQPGFVFMGKAKGDEQFSEYRAADDPALQDRRNANGNGQAKQRPKSALLPLKNWNAEARQFAEALTPERRAELAMALGLPESSIDAMDSIGWNEAEECWTFPECDARGNVVGINRRYLNGNKKIMASGHRGIYVPERWDCGSGPMHLVEGASDTLTLAAMGLAVIGRPSNTGGVEQLAALLKEWPSNRSIVVVGEFDPKDTGRWPGLEGAKSTAANLGKALNCPICWALPPDGAKDVRQWALQRVKNGAALDAALGKEFAAGLNVQGSKPEDAEKPLGYVFEPINSADFAAADYRMEWLVKRCIVRGQFGVIGGASKTLKTSLAVDLALSLGTGLPFLGTFDVYKPVRVCIISGESGEYTLQETAKRIAAAKGMALADADVLWDFRLPQLARVSDLTDLRRGLIKEKIGVLILDPLYLALLAGQNDINAGNLYETGPLLGAFDRACKDAGTTPISNHHFTKSHRPGQELSITDLSFSGIAEYSRQWFLIGRRTRFEPGSDFHELTVEIGGSCGQTGSWAVDVAEGALLDNFTGRTWELSVRPTGENLKDQTSVKAQKRKEAADQRKRDAKTQFLIALDNITASGKPPTLSAIRGATGWSGDKAKVTFIGLELENIVETYPVKVKSGNNNESTEEGIRRCPTA